MSTIQTYWYLDSSSAIKRSTHTWTGDIVMYLGHWQVNLYEGCSAISPFPSCFASFSLPLLFILLCLGNRRIKSSQVSFISAQWWAVSPVPDLDWLEEGFAPLPVQKITSTKSKLKVEVMVRARASTSIRSCWGARPRGRLSRCTCILGACRTPAPRRRKGPIAPSFCFWGGRGGAEAASAYKTSQSCPSVGSLAVNKK